MLGLTEKHPLLKEDRVSSLEKKRKELVVRIPFPVQHKSVVRNNNLDLDFWISAKRMARKGTEKPPAKPLKLPDLKLKPDRTFLTRKQAVDFLSVHNSASRRSNETADSLIIPPLSFQESVTRLSHPGSLPQTERANAKSENQRSILRMQSCEAVEQTSKISASGHEGPTNNSQATLTPVKLRTTDQEAISPRQKVNLRLPLESLVRNREAVIEPLRSLTERDSKFNPLSPRGLFKFEDASPTSAQKMREIVTLQQARVFGMDYCNQQRIEKIFNSDKSPLLPKSGFSSPKKSRIARFHSDKADAFQYQDGSATERIILKREEEQTNSGKSLINETIQKILREGNLLIDDFPVKLEDLEKLGQTPNVTEPTQQEVKERYRSVQQIRARSMELLKNHKTMIRKQREESYIPKDEFKFREEPEELLDHEDRHTNNLVNSIALSKSKSKQENPNSPADVNTGASTSIKQENGKLRNEYSEFQKSLLSVKHKTLIKNLEFKKNKARSDYNRLNKRADKLMTALHIYP